MELEIKKLEELLNKAELNPVKKEVINVLLTSINDWPQKVDTLDEYEKEVRKFIKGEVSEKNIRSSLNSLNLATNAWQAESLSQLEEVFKFYKDISLREIISDLKDNLAQKSKIWGQYTN